MPEKESGENSANTKAGKFRFDLREMRKSFVACRETDLDVGKRVRRVGDASQTRVTVDGWA